MGVRLGQSLRALLADSALLTAEQLQQALEKASASRTNQRAVALGTRTLLADAREQVRQGRINVEEVLRVCQRDEV